MIHAVGLIWWNWSPLLSGIRVPVRYTENGIQASFYDEHRTTVYAHAFSKKLEREISNIKGLSLIPVKLRKFHSSLLQLHVDVGTERVDDHSHFSATRPRYYSLVDALNNNKSDRRWTKRVTDWSGPRSKRKKGRPKGRLKLFFKYLSVVVAVCTAAHGNFRCFRRSKGMIAA